MATDVTTSATITYQSGLFAEITSIDWSGISREAIDVSHMGTVGGRTFIPGDLYDAGELSVELNLDQDGPYDAAIGAAAETVTVTIPDGATTATWIASGFMTGFSWNGPLEDKMTATATIKFSDEIAIT